MGQSSARSWRMSALSSWAASYRLNGRLDLGMASCRWASPMSQLGQSRRFAPLPITSGFTRTADMSLHRTKVTRCATFGLMHCGKSTLRDHLVGTRAKCPRRRACAHHRVERTDRDARHSMRSRATSSTKPPPTVAPREACTATKCGNVAPSLQKSDRGGFEARVTLPGTRQRLPRAAKWNSCGRGTPYGVTYTHFAIVSRSAATN